MCQQVMSLLYQAPHAGIHHIRLNRNFTLYVYWHLISQQNSFQKKLLLHRPNVWAIPSPDILYLYASSASLLTVLQCPWTEIRSGKTHHFVSVFSTDFPSNHFTADCLTDPDVLRVKGGRETFTECRSVKLRFQ